MITALKYVTLMVADQDEALAWYTDKLGLEKRMDMRFGAERWLSVGVPGSEGVEIALQQPSEAVYGAEVYARKLAQIGQNPTWVLGVSNCRDFVEELRGRGVTIVAEPEQKPWGVAALIADLYGNLFALQERAG
jgi:catechol 2,3-dioxygenase-like lactoylglutathione lyase family enzyme